MYESVKVKNLCSLDLWFVLPLQRKIEFIQKVEDVCHCHIKKTSIHMVHHHQIMQQLVPLICAQ